MRWGMTGVLLTAAVLACLSSGALAVHPLSRLSPELATSAIQTVPADSSFLELETGLYPTCRTGYVCPIANGVCCGGGSVCCPSRCSVGHPDKCDSAPVSKELKLALAKAKALVEHEARVEAATIHGDPYPNYEHLRMVKGSSKKPTSKRSPAPVASVQPPTDGDSNSDKSTAQDDLDAQIKRLQDEKREKDRLAQIAEAARLAQEKANAEKKKYAEQDSKSALLSKGNIEPQSANMIAPASKMAKGDAYTLMFWIQPTGTTRTMAGLLQKGSTNRERNPAISMDVDSTSLDIRSGTAKDWDEGLKTPALEPHMWTHVTIIHTQNDLTVFFNGDQVAHSTPEAPLFNDGPMWACAGWQGEPGKAIVADVRWMASVAPMEFLQAVFQARRFEENEIRETVLDRDTLVLRPGLLVARGVQMSHTAPEYSMAFWIKLIGVSRPDRQLGVLVKGPRRADGAPSIILQGQKMVGFSRTNTSVGSVESDQELQVNEWTHVVLSHKAGSLAFYFNGQAAGETTAVSQPVLNKNALYAPDSKTLAAEALIADVRMYTGYVNATGAELIMNQKRYSELPVKETILRSQGFQPYWNRVIASASQLDTTLPQYTFMFWLQPFRVMSSVGNVIAKGSKADEGPSVYMQANTTRLEVRVVVEGSPRVQTLVPPPDRDLALNQWTHIAITHLSGNLTVFFNGVEGAHLDAPTPVMNQGALRASRGRPAQVEISDLRYYNGIVSGEVLAKAVQEQYHD